ncbi:unnamed protein product [Prunus brigantina]
MTDYFLDAATVFVPNEGEIVHHIQSPIGRLLKTSRRKMW